MNLLAIDPGPEKSAYVVLQSDLAIVGHDIVGNHEMLQRISTWNYDKAVIEMVACYGMAVGAEVFETCVFIGRCIQACHQRQVPWFRLKRHDVKMALCHNTRAKDSNIRQALIDKLGPPGTKNNQGRTYGISKDKWAALALGITWLETNPEPPKGEIEPDYASIFVGGAT